MTACGNLLARKTRRLARIGVNAAFPLRCWQCENLYATKGSAEDGSEEGGKTSFSDLMGAYMCPRCAEGYMPVSGPLCVMCGRPFPSDHAEDHDCPDCLGQPMGFEAARAAGVYDQPLKTLIHHFKYQGRTELALPLGRLLWDAFIRFYDPRDFDLVLPVPLHWYRRFRRGFNQAALLLRNWGIYAEYSGIDVASMTVSTSVLIRRRLTRSQAGLGKRQRAANLKGAFVIRRAGKVRGKRVLLVDDVMTTGETASACSKTLIRAGAGTVKVLTLAKAL